MSPKACERGVAYQQIVDALFPDDADALVIDIQQTVYPIPAEELALIKTATAKRIAEFSAGRYSAHRLLDKHQRNSIPILIGAHREPVWPTGIIGSITHCKDLAGAVICTNDSCAGIGFDIETIKPFRHAIAKYICTDTELDWLDKQSEIERETLILLLFSIKESLYKCLFQATGFKFTFKEVLVCPDLSTNRAEIRLANKHKEVSVEMGLTVKFCLTRQYIFSSAVLAKAPQ